MKLKPLSKWDAMKQFKLANQAELERIHRQKSDALKAIPGVGSSSMGLTPDSVKNSDQYKVAKHELQKAWDDLREFNRKNAKQMKQDRIATQPVQPEIDTDIDATAWL